MEVAIEFLPNVICFAILILSAGVVGGVIFAIVNRGLIAIGLSVAGELAEDGGERLAEKLGPDFVKDQWDTSYRQEKDNKRFVLTKGLATGTKWLVECSFCDSEAIVSGVVIGMLSGAAAYYLEILHGADDGFLWKVSVELFGSVVGILGGSMVLALIVAIFRYPLELLSEFLALGLIIGIIALLIKGCSML